MRKLSILVSVLAMMAAACGGSSGSGSPLANQAPDTTATPTSTTVNGNANGDTAATTSDTSVPADFPLPVPDNIDIIDASTTSGDQGEGWELTFHFDPSRVDEISQLYEDATTNQGFNIEGNYRDADFSSLIASKDKLNIEVLMTNYGDYWKAFVKWFS